MNALLFSERRLVGLVNAFMLRLVTRIQNKIVM